MSAIAVFTVKKARAAKWSLFIVVMPSARPAQARTIIAARRAGNFGGRLRNSDLQCLRASLRNGEVGADYAGGELEMFRTEFNTVYRFSGQPKEPTVPRSLFREVLSSSSKVNEWLICAVHQAAMVL